MKPSKMSLLFTLPLFVLCSLTSSASGAQDNKGSYAWPYLIVSGGDSIWLYQPQATSLSGQTLQGSQSVSIHSQGETQNRYGVVYFQANTNDAGNGRVTLSNYTITRQNFPSLTDNGQSLVQTITANAGALPVVSQRKLQDDVALAGKKLGTGSGVAVKNDPPAIIHSSDPALLVIIDGQPHMTQVQGTSYQRIMNTNFMILYDGTNYYTPIGDQWAVTSDLANTNWTIAPASDALNDAKAKLQADKSLNLSIPDNNSDEVAAAAQNGTLPLLYVSERPAELLVTNGNPDYQPISGTNLTYAQNAKGDLFQDSDDGRTYTLISGRWYSAPSIDGPWTWVDPTQLPADFSKIPQDNPEARVLVSVPNTSQSQEAVMANDIPQTATVDRSQASFKANYDGDPKFKAISNTDLEYATNASAPVIRDGDEFYACDKAVWFQSASPYGPWTVAVHVPDEIYAIPSNSPVYNVTYVKVYDYDQADDDVTFGYTPGYFGVYDSYWGCPVFGTGWWYRPWIGSYWYGYPYSFGYGAGFGWGPAWGFGAYFNFGFGFYSPCYRPWWGPWGWYHPFYGGYGHWGGPVFINRVNIYNSWGRGGFVHVNRGPISGAPGRVMRNSIAPGGGRIGTMPGNRINSFASRGSIYGRNQVNGGFSRPAAMNSRVATNGFAQNRSFQPQAQNRSFQPQAQNRTFQPQAQNRTFQPQAQSQNRTFQQQPQQRTFQQPQRAAAPARTYSAPAFRGGGGGGGYRGGGGGFGGGSRGGGGGGGRGGRH
ncbi:hypothetical protein [Dinghuibacter silviterrae]|uniref:Carbohydrate-binding family V/XII n=1 Tax=Dinghuibacter silviterrae TaxID=1539049 RepID=A0A4R8DGW9_9BACT|nr:hypothetical protein [Dinghuibacter silviterrae]TDW96765.1 hypothetical protein EDB95_4601 [Dinghuibacter silviterrae]